MELLINFYHGMPQVIRWCMDYFFVVIILRGFLAAEINKELRRAWTWLRSERTRAIFWHYWERAKGNGHQTENVLDCHQQLCKVF